MNKLDLTKIYGNTGKGSSIDLSALKAKASTLAKFTPALLLAGVVPAEAQVVCNDSGAPIVVSGTYSSKGSVSIDIDGDGNIDFYVSARTTFYNAMGGYLSGPGSNNVVGVQHSTQTYYTAANLAAGFPNGATLPPGYTSDGNETLAYPNYNWGNFQAPNNGFAAVSFDIAGSTHYGWIELTTSGGPADGGPPGLVTVEGFCYESTPGATILTGDRASALIPTLGEWALISLNLLLMIFGVVALKQRGAIAIKKRA
jgi:hypothetical protein